MPRPPSVSLYLPSLSASHVLVFRSVTWTFITAAMCSYTNRGYRLELSWLCLMIYDIRLWPSLALWQRWQTPPLNTDSHTFRISVHSHIPDLNKRKVSLGDRLKVWNHFFEVIYMLLQNQQEKQVRTEEKTAFTRNLILCYLDEDGSIVVWCWWWTGAWAYLDGNYTLMTTEWELTNSHREKLLGATGESSSHCKENVA